MRALLLVVAGLSACAPRQPEPGPTFGCVVKDLPLETLGELW